MDGDVGWNVGRVRVWEINWNEGDKMGIMGRMDGMRWWNNAGKCVIFGQCAEKFWPFSILNL